MPEIDLGTLRAGARIDATPLEKGVNFDVIPAHTEKVITFSPFVASGSHPCLTAGQTYYVSDNPVQILANGYVCARLIGMPCRRMADGRIELSVSVPGSDSGFYPAGPLYLMARPTTKPGQWAAKLPFSLPDYIDVTFAATGNTIVDTIPSIGGGPYDCACFARTYRLQRTIATDHVSRWCNFAATAATLLPPSCRRWWQVWGSGAFRWIPGPAFAPDNAGGEWYWTPYNSTEFAVTVLHRTTGQLVVVAGDWPPAVTDTDVTIATAEFGGHSTTPDPEMFCGRVPPNRIDISFGVTNPVHAGGAPSFGLHQQFPLRVRVGGAGVHYDSWEWTVRFST